MNKQILLILTCIHLSTLLPAQKFSWAQTWGLAGSDDFAFATCIDKAGNVYAAGGFYGPVDFDPGAGVFTLPGLGGGDAYITKFNAAGKFQWAKSWGTSSPESCNSIIIGKDQNIYISGALHGAGTSKFGPYSLTPVSAGLADVFLCKLDSTGTYLWAKQFGGQGYDGASVLSTDLKGNIYVAGGFEQTVDFDPGPGEFKMTVKDKSTNGFISKFDSNGIFKWAKQFSGNNPKTIYLDNQQNVFLGGDFEGSGDFNPGQDVFNLSFVAGKDMYVLKLDSSGSFVYAKHMGGNHHDYFTSLAVDTKGNVFCSGYFLGTTDLDPGVSVFNNPTSSTSYYNSFISKLDAKGNFMWGKFYNSGDLELNKIALDSSDNLYLTGSFRFSTDFNLGSGQANLSPLNTDLFLQKLNSDGNFLWVLPFKGISESSYTYPTTLSLGPANEIVVGGAYKFQVDFNPGSEEFLGAVTTNYYNPFVVKLTQDLVTGLVSTKIQDDSPVVRVYPNPGNGKLLVDLGKSYDQVSAKISNMNGKVFLSDYFINSATLSLEINEPAGFYILDLSSPEGSISTIKIIKQ